jgi:hypothetical protein
MQHGLTNPNKAFLSLSLIRSYVEKHAMYLAVYGNKSLPLQQRILTY